MTHGVCALCRREVAPGFALAGIPTIERAAEVEDCVARHRAGVLMIEQDLYQELPEELRSKLEGRAVPMVVLFPPPSWRAERAGEAYVVEMLRRAIGYRVRLK